MDQPEILLAGPGPSPTSHAVRQAQAAPLLGHLDPDFLAIVDRVQAGLRTLFGTGNEFTLPISGTGSAGMEAVLTNLLEPGDRIVIGVHGVFGQRLVQLARRLQAEVVEVTAEFGTALDPAAMARAIATGPTRVVAVVHAETSTGVLQPLPEIAAAARAAGALFVVDCVTSIGGRELSWDALGVDAAFAGTQKCLSAPPGLSPVTFSPRALARVAARRSPVPSFYFDTTLLVGYFGPGRAYHHTAPISLVAALDAALGEVLAEGLPARSRRHDDVARALRAALQALGLQLLVPDPIATPMLTSVRLPAGVDDKPLRAFLRQAWRIEIGGGLGPLAGRIVRIGLMGHGARPENVRRIVAALADGLARQGVRGDLAAALAAVQC
ncbi:MAG: alanine--glyoxylate aminotransferase family protein [Planctomycetes bacterium]|nr:alanine--glyoxylate aminotransferase family protein [Planctomycetota bacterium]